MAVLPDRHVIQTELIHSHGTVIFNHIIDFANLLQ